ncbi:hypothetical protein ACIG63_05595 [Streptomyces antimycoticus]|uniref:hypothetical protein n=1 Tax=Streptomyces antimycoticus TaxID=68175 RepID=UPI0037D84F63
MRRGLRLAAVLTVVLVALTGFKGRGHGHGGGGGGCSSSSSHHSGSGSGSSSGSGGYSDSDDESSTTGAGSGGSRYRDYDDDGDSASSGTTSPNAPQVTVVSCAGKDKSGHSAATVKVRNRSGAADTYLVDMSFQDRDGSTLTTGRADVRVPAGKSRTVRVPLDDPSVSGTVVRCEVVSVL